MAALQKWLKGLPLSRRPLVKLTARVAPEPAVKMLQAALPPRAREQAAVELENVATTLLLPPTGGWWVWWGVGWADEKVGGGGAEQRAPRPPRVPAAPETKQGTSAHPAPDPSPPPCPLLLSLTPAEKGGMTAALAGGIFDIGDRVAAIAGSGSPPFGSRGTVVGTYDDAVEVGGGCRGCRGRNSLRNSLGTDNAGHRNER